MIVLNDSGTSVRLNEERAPLTKTYAIQAGNIAQRYKLVFVYFFSWLFCYILFACVQGSSDLGDITHTSNKTFAFMMATVWREGVATIRIRSAVFDYSPPFADQERHVCSLRSIHLCL